MVDTYGEIYILIKCHHLISAVSDDGDYLNVA